MSPYWSSLFCRGARLAHSSLSHQEGGERYSERCWPRATRSHSIIAVKSLPLKQTKIEGKLLRVHFLNMRNSLPMRNISPWKENNPALLHIEILNCFLCGCSFLVFHL